MSDLALLKTFLRKNWVLLVLIFVYLLLFVLLPPKGEFPLNDDWAYAQTVKNFLEGDFRLSNWIAATSLFHLFWGYLFSLLFGFSFSVLRISILVMGFLGAVGFYLLLKEILKDEKLSLLGTFTLVFNPLYFYLSYTFMTEVTFVTTLLWSLLFYVKGFKNRNDTFLLLGSVFSAFAVLTRQWGIFIPLAAAVYLFLVRGGGIKNWRCFFKIVFLPIFSFVVYQLWYQFVHGPTLAYQTASFGGTIKFLTNPKESLPVILDRVLASFFYLGLFLSPLLLGYVVNIRKAFEFARKNIILLCPWMILIFGFVVWRWVSSKTLMPYLPNILSESGFFPTPIMGLKTTIFSHPLRAKGTLTLAGALTAGILASLLFLRFRQFLLDMRRGISADVSVFIYLVGALLFFANLLFSSFYDRYLILWFPVFIVLVLECGKRFKISGTVLVLTFSLLAMTTLAQEKDHLSWNTVRWEIGRSLLAEGVLPEEVDVGFEWKGWYLFEERSQKLIERGEDWTLGSWYPGGMRYVLSFSVPPPYEGFEVLKVFSYRTPLSFRGEENIYLLERGR